MSTSVAAAEPVLTASGVYKRYGGVQALKGAHMTLYPDEVHGLCGENGSGKSTLLKVISGQVPSNAGRVVLDGEPTDFRDAADALAAGIATVTQETTLVPELSVAENIFLGRQKRRGWRGIDWAATRMQANAVLDSLGCDVDPDVPVSRLPPDLQQMVEIARALSSKARVLILDEPTSSLADDEVESLFGAIRALKGSGIAVVFVSHRLNEVFDIADRLTVLRDGEVVGRGPISEFDQPGLIRLMIGRELEQLSLEPAGQGRHDAALRVHEFSLPGRFQSATFEVDRGEAVGLAGLVGAGRSELLRALFGLEPDASGAVTVNGETTSIRSPGDAIHAGMALVPADRKRLGLVLDMSVRENVVMARTSFRPRGRRPRRGEEQATVVEAINDFEIVLYDPADSASRLSGGNQQKVVLAKWFGTEPQVLLLDEPTRGVDVGAKAAIYRLLNAAKARGVALVISSSEIPELQLLCDRILVMYRGRIVAELDREQADEAQIARFAMGHEG